MSNSETLFAVMTVFTKRSSGRNLQNRKEIQCNSQPSLFSCSSHISHMLIELAWGHPGLFLRVSVIIGLKIASCNEQNLQTRAISHSQRQKVESVNGRNNIKGQYSNFTQESSSREKAAKEKRETRASHTTFQD